MFGFNARLFFDTGLATRLLSFVPTEAVNAEECAQLLRHIASTPTLPPQYWLTLHCLLRHFARVCQSGSKNLLSARALGEIFSPVFFRQQTTRWVWEQQERASLPHTVSKIDTQTRSRQTSVQAQSCNTGAHRLSNMHTCTYISGKRTRAHTHAVSNTERSLSGTRGFQLHRYRLELFYLAAVLCN